MQLDLFSPIVDSFNRLIDALNDGRKPKELYFGIEIYKVSNDRFLSFVMNKEKDCIFNIVDKNGKIPDGFSSCWRIWQHIERELNITVSDLDNLEVVYHGAITEKK